MLLKSKKRLSWVLCGLLVISWPGQASTLSKEDQLRAASLKNEISGQIAQTSVDYLDQVCQGLGDHQTSLYLDSDYHATLVALNSILPNIYFDTLHQNSLQYAHCDTFSNALRYIHSQLGIK